MFNDENFAPGHEIYDPDHHFHPMVDEVRTIAPKTAKACICPECFDYYDNVFGVRPYGWMIRCSKELRSPQDYAYFQILEDYCEALANVRDDIRYWDSLNGLGCWNHRMGGIHTLVLPGQTDMHVGKPSASCAACAHSTRIRKREQEGCVAKARYLAVGLMKVISFRLRQVRRNNNVNFMKINPFYESNFDV